MLREGIKTFKFIKELKNFRAASDSLTKDRAKDYLANLLSEDGGILLKVAQYMGTKDDDISSIVTPTLEEKKSGLSSDEVERILKREFKGDAERISQISKGAFYASIGQVNSAQLDGDLKVAIKTQYPKIKKVLKEQLKIINILPIASQYSSIKKWGVEFSSYQKMIEKVLEQECNYHYEIDELRKWKNYTSHLEFIKIPEVIKGFDKSEIYVQEYIEGVNIDEVTLSWSDPEKKYIANGMVESFFSILAKHNCFQGDTNFGNYIFTKEQIGLIDLGQTVYLDEKIVKAFFKALSCEFSGEEYSKLGLMVELGFDQKKLSHLSLKTGLLVDILIEPLVVDYAYDMNSWKYQANLDLLLGEDKWWFRSAGSTDFFLLMKSFMGLKNLISKLDTSIFFKAILLRIIKDMDLESYSIPEVVIDKEL